MVRAVSLEALAGQRGTESVLLKGVADRTHQVRAAAIRALSAAGARSAWPVVQQRLTDKDEWPEVQTEGVRFARTLCVREAAPALLDVVRRGIKPEAWAPDADLGLLAFEALSQLGGSEAKTAASLAGSSTAPAGFGQALRAQAIHAPACATRR
jgi:HEAT repeat protein